MTQTVLDVNPSDISNDLDGLGHYYCEVCNPYPDLICISMCGMNITDYKYLDEDTQIDCVVCTDLAYKYCQYCGT